MRNDHEGICQIINSNVQKITSQVTGIVLAQSQPMEIDDPCVLSLSARGTYEFDLHLHADKATLKRIASSMKRGDATDEEIPLYSIEFFNILGGNIISQINRHYQQSARFRVPTFKTEFNQPIAAAEDGMTLFYRYLDGNVKIKGQFVNNETN